MNNLPGVLGDKTNILVSKGTTENDLWKHFHMANLHSSQYRDIENNPYLKLIDDSGTPCLPLSIYNQLLQEIVNKAEGFERFVEQYIQKRVKKYTSPRRSEPQISLRGEIYYAHVNEELSDYDYKQVLIQDLQESILFYDVCQKNRLSIPNVFVLMVVDHLKNLLFKVIYAYMQRAVRDKIFNIRVWNTLDGLGRSLWEGYPRVILTPDGKITGTIDFTVVEQLLGELSISRKIKEFDSAKNLLRFARSVELSELNYSVCVTLLHGGIEIPYALHGYNAIMVNENRNFTIVPVIFSTNRVFKEEIDSSIISATGVIKERDLGHISTELINAIQPNSEVLVVDNNITTGYSLFVIKNTLSALGARVHLGVPEIYFDEIKNICDRKSGFENKEICITGEDLAIRPIDKYVTCFGLKDSSRVVNRIKFLLSTKDYTQIIGYDFDDTIAETGRLHGQAWDHALISLGIKNVTVKELPSNSGLTNYEAGVNIHRWLLEKDVDITLEAKQFVKKIVALKLNFLLNYDLKSVPLIASVVNTIKKNQLINTQIIVTNNSYAFVRKFLLQRNLLQYFSYVICADYAYCATTEEVIKLTGRPKPSVDAYMEACEFFGISSIREFYGDSLLTDKIFAQKLGCKFHLI